MSVGGTGVSVGGMGVSVGGTGVSVTVGGDVVIGLGGTDVRRFDDILAYLDRYGEVGQELELTIIRDEKTQTLTVTLGKRQEIVVEEQ